MSKHINIKQTLHQPIFFTFNWAILLLLFIVPTAQSQTDHSINYCSLMEAADNYGRLSIQYKDEVPPNEVGFFNSQFAASFNLRQGTISKIDQNEFQSSGVFDYGITSSFPSTAGYHPSHTSPHDVFHIVKEVYRIQHHSPSCIVCVQNSLDTLNLILQSTPLWSDFNKSYRLSTGGNPIKRSEMLIFSTFLKCYYFDDFMYTHNIKNSKLGPTFITPTDTTFITCANEIKVVEPNYTRSCDMPTKLQFLGTSLYRGAENCTGAVYRATHSINSPCGKDTTHQYFVLKNDGPKIDCPADKVVSCLEQVVADSPKVTTSCGLGHTLTIEGPKLLSGQSKCDGSVYEVKYIVIDACNRRVECVQQITIRMTTPLTITCDQDIVVICKSQIIAGIPTAKSPCGLEVIITQSGPTLINGRDNCPGAIYEIIYTAEDECGSEATCNRRFTIRNDGPTIKCAQDQTVECKDDIKGTDPTVETSCGQDYTVTTGSVTLESGVDKCDGAVYSITYTITEECGRIEECTQRFTLANDPPFMICPDDLTLECIEDLEEQDVDIQTSCNLDSDDESSDPELVAGTENCPGAMYEIKYGVIDECDRAAGCIQYIKIENDPPTIVCPPDETVESVDDIVESQPEVTVSCNLDTEVTVSGPHHVSGDPDCPDAVYKLTYTVKDACDRTAECDQLFTITGQDIIIDCPPDIVVKCKDDIYPHISNRGSSWLYGNTVEFTSSDPKALDDDEDCPGTVYEVIHEYKHKCEAAFQCIQRFTIENDGPRIICPPDQVIGSLQDPYDQKAEIHVDCNLPYELDISEPELITGQFNQPGSEYYVTYKVTDDCDRDATCKQKLTIIAMPPGQRDPCNCVDEWFGVSQDLIEDRSTRFNQDIALLLKKKTCKELKTMITDGVTSIYSAWASSEILGSDYVFTQMIQKRGPLDLTMRNLGEVNKQIKNVEAILFGDEKEIRKLLAPQLLEELAKLWGLGGPPVAALKAVQNLGKFTEYLNKEILISNMKTLADIAKRDPDFFDVHHFMKEYVKIDDLKTIKQNPDPEAFRYRNMINEYVTFRLGSTTPLNVRDVWKSQENVNLYYSHTKSMLMEICDLYCYLIKIKESVDRLKEEQSMIFRFKEVYEYFQSYDCQGVIKPDCSQFNATMVQNTDGTYRCDCTGNTRWNPDKNKCVPFQDCSTIANTIAVFQAGEYKCDCIQPEFRWDPDKKKCVEFPNCTTANMAAQWNSDFEVYECQCDPGYKWDPDYKFCAEYEDCSDRPNTKLKWNASNQAYRCDCEAGFKWDPDISFCASVQDCSTLPYTKLEWDAGSNSYRCNCLPGYELDPSRQFCVSKPDCTIPNAILKYNETKSVYECICDKGYKKDNAGNCIFDVPDCSTLVNAEPVWNPTFEVYECQCVKGYVFEDGRCIKEKPNCSLLYSNTEAVWNAQVQDYECQCINGYSYDPNTGNCEANVPDCSGYYRNTKPVWSTFNNEFECDCITGFVWNQSRTDCIDPLAIAQASCNYANARVKYNKKKNEYKCECVRGYKWNKSRTGCQQKTGFRDALAGLTAVAVAVYDGTNTGTLGGIPTGGNNNPQVLPQNEHQGECSKQYGSGANHPESYTFQVGFLGGGSTFEYETYTAKDRIHIYQNGRKIHDSGCVGTKGWRSANLQIGMGPVRVVVDPLCDPSDSQTEWKFVLGCPQ